MSIEYKHRIHEFIDWNLIEKRVKDYPATGETFPPEFLQRYSDKAPFYIHYMSWRLGIEGYEEVISHFEKLLGCASSMPGWENERSLLRTAEFGDFWSLVWQLQVAEWLCKIAKDVCWSDGSGGPDLSAELNGGHWYVECYMPRKSFGLVTLIEDILYLQNIQDVHVGYNLCRPFSLPQGNSRATFLDTILETVLDPVCLAEAREGAKEEYPVIIYKGPEENAGNPLYIYLEGNGEYIPGRVPNEPPPVKTYMEEVLKKALKAKEGKNNLLERRPNMLAVNYALDKGYQLTEGLTRLELEPPHVAASPEIDLLAASTVGVDKFLTTPDLKIWDHTGSLENQWLKFTS